MPRYCTSNWLAAPLAIAILAGAAAGTAAQNAEFERILLPVTVEGVAGVGGSTWTTEAWIRNDSESAIGVFPLIISDVALGPHITQPLQVVLFTGSQPPGQFLFVPRTAVDRVRITLRATDTSRGQNRIAAELPVVRERQFVTTSLTFLSVPTTPDARVMLRVYESSLPGTGTARVDVFEERTDRLIATQDVQLPRPFPADTVPGYAQIWFPGAFPHIDAARVRILVTPTTPGTTIWSFVTVTGNDTQQVAIMTPH